MATEKFKSWVRAIWPRAIEEKERVWRTGDQVLLVDKDGHEFAVAIIERYQDGRYQVVPLQETRCSLLGTGPGCLDLYCAPGHGAGLADGGEPFPTEADDILTELPAGYLREEYCWIHAEEGHIADRACMRDVGMID